MQEILLNTKKYANQEAKISTHI